MPEQFHWVPDIERGAWLRGMEDEPFGSTLSIVPRGFEAYARIFHPVERDRPRATKTWQHVDETTYFVGVEDIGAALESQRVTWADAAASFNTTMHAAAQYEAIVCRDQGNTTSAIAPDGWRYLDTLEGSIEVETLARLAQVLTRHTSTPGTGIAAIWEGWGGLVSSAGQAYVQFESNEPDNAIPHAGSHSTLHALHTRLAAVLRRAIAGARLRLSGLPHKQPRPGSGVLSYEAAAGPRFELHAGTGRRYILFDAGATDFADGTWTNRAPWVAESIGTQSPSMLWPNDHAWMLATEIDFDSTLVAGTNELIHQLTHTPGLEALRIEPSTAPR